MTKLGLILGGGGIVGIAWETAVLAGLQEACGFDPSSSSVVVGTSAGSVVGAIVALRKNLGEVVAELRADRTSRAGTTTPPDFSSGPMGEIFGLFGSEEGRTPAGILRMGELAMSVETALTEGAFIKSFDRTVGTDTWSDVDLRVTSTRCSTGERVVWDRNSGIPLQRAVASSCAIPGFYPTVTFKGEHYMDGPRGVGYNADIVSGDGLDAVLFLGPDLGAAHGLEWMMRTELDALRALGVKLHIITGGDEFQAANFNLMDPGSRERAVDIGLREGKAEAANVAPLIS